MVKQVTNEVDVTARIRDKYIGHDYMYLNNGIGLIIGQSTSTFKSGQIMSGKYPYRTLKWMEGSEVAVENATSNGNNATQ